MPFERLVEVLNPDRSLSRHPLFQVMVVYLTGAPKPLNLSGLTCLPVRVDWTTAKFDLSFDVTDLGAEGMSGSLEYSADLFDASTAAMIGARLVRVLEQIAAAPQTRLRSIDALLPGELEQVTGGMGGRWPGFAGHARTDRRRGVRSAGPAHAG